MRLPNWTEEELILTLDLYLKIRRGEAKQTHSELKKMSEKLRNLNIHPEFKDNPTFRNANGISRKLGNFSAIDPDYEGKGLHACSIMDKEIFMRFFKNPKELKQEVSKIEKKYLDKIKAKNKRLPWTEEELILTLALYKVLTFGQMHGTNPRVKALSKVLNELPIYDKDICSENFRSISSVSLRLSNFRSCDPKCNAKGLLSSGTGLFKEIFNKYYKKDELLAHAVADIEKKYDISIRHIIFSQDNNFHKNELNEEIQGNSLYQLHKKKESESSFYRKVKNYHYGRSGECTICGTEPDKLYGKLGDNILEYHCIKKFPVNESPPSEVCIGDYVQVCPTCHKLLDKYYSLMDYDDLRNIIRNV